MPTVGPRKDRNRFGRDSREILALQHDASARLTQAGRQQAQHGARRHRLAAAGLADHGQEFAALDMEGDVIDHRDAGAFDLDAQVFDVEQRGGHPCAIRGSRRSRSESPSRLMPSSVSAMQSPGAMLSQAANSM